MDIWWRELLLSSFPTRAAERGQVFRQAVLACRKGGTVSVPGVYSGF
jgi:threonine dehydrogenase-like Zn-dependent dehydrogenase